MKKVQFKFYLPDGTVETNTDNDYLVSIGMDAEFIAKVAASNVGHHKLNYESEAGWRDEELAGTDYMLLPDAAYVGSGMSEAKLSELQKYRAELRDYEYGTVIERPVRPVMLSDSSYSDSDITAQKKVNVAKVARKTNRYSPITVDGLVFDSDEEAYKNLTGSILNWDTIIADASLATLGAVVDGKLLWVLADNSVAFVTKAQLQDVIGAIAVRAVKLQLTYMIDKA